MCGVALKHFFSMSRDWLYSVTVGFDSQVQSDGVHLHFFVGEKSHLTREYIIMHHVSYLAELYCHRRPAPANQFYALYTVYQRSDPSHRHASSNPDMPGGTFHPFIGFISHIHLGKTVRKIEEWRPVQEKKPWKVVGQTFHLSHSKQGQFDFLLPVSPATAQGFLLVGGVTLDICHRPVLSRGVQLNSWQSRSKVKISPPPRKALSAVLCYSFKVKKPLSLDKSAITSASALTPLAAASSSFPFLHLWLLLSPQLIGSRLAMQCSP